MDDTPLITSRCTTQYGYVTSTQVASTTTECYDELHQYGIYAIDFGFILAVIGVALSIWAINKWI